MASSCDEQKSSLEVDPLSRANTHLAVNVYNVLAAEGKNVFFSPFSLSAALAMLFCGAEGDTYKELRKVLGFEITEMEREAVSSSFQSHLANLRQTSDCYLLTAANSMVSRQGFSIKEDFKSLLSESFFAFISEADFQNDTKKALEQINDWVKEETQGMIPQLLESLEPSTVCVLLSAVYFKGKWLHQFSEKSTFRQYFYNHGIEDTAVLVDTMHMKDSFLFVEKENFKVLQLPYKGEEMAMLILLPNSLDGLVQLEEALSSNFIQDLKKEMRKSKVEVALPKFRLEYSKFLKSAFQKLGMKIVFQCGAEFDRISDCRNLEVSEIVHKAVLEVNEEGSEAAAATAVKVCYRAMSMDPEFIADHPFAVVIYNVINDFIFFMGRVVELEGATTPS